MSRGYDGPEIDDFRDSGWERERSNSNRNSSRGTTDWQTRASVKLELDKIREAESSSDHAIAQNREHSRDSLSSLSREGRQAETLRERDRSQYKDRDRTYALRSSEIHTLTEVGKFRVLGVDDLTTFAYNGDRERMQSDLRSLARQGLIEHRGTTPLKKESRRVLTLPIKGNA